MGGLSSLKRKRIGMPCALFETLLFLPLPAAILSSDYRTSIPLSILGYPYSTSLAEPSSDSSLRRPLMQNTKAYRVFAEDSPPRLLCLVPVLHLSTICCTVNCIWSPTVAKYPSPLVLLGRRRDAPDLG